MLWDGGWYGGHHALGYSVFFPALAAALGARLAGALSAVAAAACFAAIARRAFGADALVGATWFGAAVAASLASGRLTFTLGVAVGLAAIGAAQRGWAALGALLALAASLASPVAGVFVALAGGAWALAAGGIRALALAAGALLGLVALGVAFPEGGREPFVASSFWPALAGVVIVGALLPSRLRALRIGAALYALALIGAFAVPSALGGNAVRLGALFAGPLAACALWRHRRLLAALVLPLAYWQLVAPVRDVVVVSADRSVQASYYRALLARLSRAGTPIRIEIPLTSSHWEAYRVAPAVALARGWERQLDIRDNALFYRPGLDPASYRAWLDANAIAYVALPDARLDASARAEVRLVAGGLPYLDEIWHDAHWRLFAVRAARPPAQGPGTLASWGPQGFELRVRSAGSFRVAERFTPYWALTRGAGCVSQTPDGYTQVSARAPGTITVAIRFSLARVRAGGPRCTSTHP